MRELSSNEIQQISGGFGYSRALQKGYEIAKSIAISEAWNAAKSVDWSDVFSRQDSSSWM